MRNLCVVSIMMLLLLLDATGQTTYLVKTPCGAAYQTENPLLATFTGDIPNDVSSAKALEAYKNPGKNIEYKSESNPIYNKSGFRKNPIEKKDYVMYQEGKLIPQPSRSISSSERFAWDNLIYLVILSIVSLLLTLFFWEKDNWIGDFFSLLPYILTFIGFLMVFLFCGKSPGSDPLITIPICSSTIIIGLVVGYLLRKIEMKRRDASAEEFDKHLEKEYGSLSKKNK